MKRVLPILIILFLASAVFASAWTVETYGGTSINFPRINKGYTNRKYEARMGFTAGASAEFQVCNFFGVKGGLNVLSKNFRTHLSYAENNKELTSYDEKYNDLYLEMPIMGDFSFGKSFKAHVYAGAYCGVWLSRYGKADAESSAMNGTIEVSKQKHEWNKDYDNRFNVGGVGGLGASYNFNEHWALALDALCYFDFTSYQKKVSSIYKEYAGNATLTAQLGVAYTF